jgi:hypothetical protein
MTRMATGVLATWILAGVAGCDVRAGSNYEGESLLSLRGSVSVAADGGVETLVPALAFPDRGGAVHLVDVEATGTFPAAFKLDVLVPPPAEAMIEAERGGETILLDAPPLAIGYVTAVGPDHPDTLSFSTIEWTEFSHCASGAELASILTLPPNQLEEWRALPRVCAEEKFVRSPPEGPVLYHSVKRCEESYLQCEVVFEEGNARYATREGVADPLSSFAGFSTNYLILYLTAAAPAGTVLAHNLGGNHALEAGYHLFASMDWTDAEREQNARCVGAAESEVLDQYNRAHDTSYERYDLLLWYIDRAEEDALAAAPIGRTGELAESTARVQLGIDKARAQVAMGCYVTKTRFERVDRPGQAEISIQIGQTTTAPTIYSP